MDTAGYLDALRTEGRRLADAARGAGVGATVPTCQGWSVADLVAHTARVYRQRTHILSTGATERPARDAWDVPDPEGDGVLDWFDDELLALLATLDRVDPAMPAWTWWEPDRTAGFWFRRMAHETAVHRVDAEAATGDPAPVATDLALDGIDEAIERFVVSDVEPGMVPGPPVTVHLHATDGEGEWLVHLGPEGASFERGHAKGDAALRGSASDLLLWLWGRVPVERLERFGDEGAVVKLRAVAAAVT